MYALQVDPERRKRWRTIVLAITVATGLFAAIAMAGARIDLRPPRLPVAPIQMRIVQTLPALPQIASPVLPELPAPPPPAPPKVDEKPRPPEAPFPMPAAEAVAQQEAAPPPLVVGLTLSSTSRKSHGPRFGVGNTLLGVPQREARAPTEGTMVRAPLPVTGASSVVRSGIAADKQTAAAKVLRSAPPAYAALAKREGIEGVVVLSITIDASGRVESARVLRGLGYGLDEAAVHAARKTLWVPATLDGNSVRSTRRFNVRFTLQS